MARAGTLGKHNPLRPSVGAGYQNRDFHRPARKGIGNTHFNYRDSLRGLRLTMALEGRGRILEFMEKVVGPKFNLPEALDGTGVHLMDVPLCQLAYRSNQFSYRQLAQYFGTTVEEIKSIVL